MSARAAAPALALVLAAALPGCGRGRGRPTIKPRPEPDGVAPLLVPGARSPRLASYRIDARLDDTKHRIAGSERLTWRNGGGKAVETLPFHLYMNAFKNESSLFWKESGGHHRTASAHAGEWGWIDVTKVAIDGGPDVRASARFPGPDQTVLEVPLAAPVPPGGTVTVDFDFEVQLPRAWARTGYEGELTVAGQWFPKIGVRVGAGEDERWHCEPFHLFSEFFADFGVYDVTLVVPETHVVAATGVLQSADDNGDGTRTLVYRAEDVHDFVWIADPYMTVMSAPAHTANGTVEVRVYYRPEQARFAARDLAAGVGAIERFSSLLHPYPWPIMSIVDPPARADLAVGGMEYPMLVTAGGDHALAAEGVRMPEATTIHEVGHNWFQGMLASNEVDEAWMDEGLNEYVDGLVMADLYGETGSAIDFAGWQVSYEELQSARLGSQDPDPIATRSYEFVDFDAYGRETYARTAMAMRTLEGIVGRDRLVAALSAYAREQAFRHPSEADLVAVLERELGQDLDWFWIPAFHGAGVVDFRVRDVDCRPRHDPRGAFGEGETRKVVGEAGAPDGEVFACDVLVVNLGAVLVPVDVEVRFTDGEVVTVRWDDRKRWHRFPFERTAPVAEVRIDPKADAPLDDDRTESSWRVEPDGAASRRAAARAMFWTQTMMQVSGL